MRAIEILQDLLDNDNCTDFVDSYIQKAIDEINDYYTHKDSFKFVDKCPEYKTIEQYKMFIDSRYKDITNMTKAIREAESKILSYK